jgi:thioredoxin reductase (NADPH)
MSDTPKNCDVLVLGSGPAGYTSAIYASRADLKTLVLAGPEPGGQLTTTTEVENFPGFPEGIMGPELMERLQKQAERFGTEVVYDNCTKLVGVEEGGFHATTGAGEVVEARSVIVATGATARYLPIENLQRLRNGGGVTACATCDGFFYRDQDVMVIGGGDTAMEEALFLTKFCASVTVVHRRDKFRASKIMQERVLKHEKIKVAWDSVLEDVLGEEAVTGVKLKNVKTEEVTEVACTGVFMAIGHKPNTDFLDGLLDTDETGYLVVEDQVCTKVSGIFAAGDVRDHRFRQAISAAGWGCMAALEAERYLESQDA